jgi:fructan beta-fructosidase
MNPGGPNGGSATQYFVGHFDGKSFKPESIETRWIDYGTDNYAGVSFFNTGNRKIAMGWMNNWQYAGLVPTQGWRGAMTLPREISLKPVGNKLFLSSVPVTELKQLIVPAISKENVTVNNELDLSSELKNAKGRFKLEISLATASDFSINLSNDKGEELIIGYEKSSNQYFIDRTKAGESAFEKGFAKRHTAPRISTSNTIDLSLYIDAASAEVFADKGLNVFTDTFFPNSLASNLKIKSVDNIKVSKLQLAEVKSIWK